MRVVIVEDNAIYKEELINCLNQEAEAVDIVGITDNGAEGLAVIEKVRPDVVFTDIRMPEMDGFEMIEAIRRKHIFCKFVVVSSCPEFVYAKRAMQLGVSDYLLKPVKLSEIRMVLRRLEEELRDRDRWVHLLNLEYVFLNAITGQIREDERMEVLIQERYGIRVHERIAVLGIGMGSNYDEYKDYVSRTLHELQEYNASFRVYPMELSGRHSFVALIYHMEDEKATYQYLEQNIIPVLGKEVRGRMVCSWDVSDGFRNMHETVQRLDRIAEWNLILEKGTLICEEKIRRIHLHPFKYPVELEKEAKEALDARDLQRFKETFTSYRAYCRGLPCTPQEAKEGCIRIALVLIQMATEVGAAEVQLKGQRFLRGISRANGWTDIEERVESFFEYLTEREGEGEKISLLIQKALEYIREYYDQGITLEEISGRLHVTEEYLSSQFRKETGKTFSEIIRTYRIENVKRLLTTTTYKLNQIAEMVGYADPKYMSRVFKEKTGILPLDYRKKNG